MKLKKPDKKATVRKKILPVYESILDKHLYSKLFLKYYLILLKRYFGSKDKDIKSFMVDFHEGIGKMICDMVQFNHLTEKKTAQLAYNIIYIEKVNSK